MLQSALRIAPADGEFGPQTQAKVVAYQKARKLSATGIVTSPVWRAPEPDAARSSAAAARGADGAALAADRPRWWRYRWPGPDVLAGAVPKVTGTVRGRYDKVRG